MTPEQLAEIEGRLAAVTPGEWELSRYDHGGGRIWDSATKRVLIADLYQEGDREFIAHARTDIPALIAELKRCQAVIAKVERLIRDEETGFVGIRGWYVNTRSLRAALAGTTTENGE